MESHFIMNMSVMWHVVGLVTRIVQMKIDGLFLKMQDNDGVQR
jgi:hypothetical protein